jgi:hypothetical protein
MAQVMWHRQTAISDRHFEMRTECFNNLKMMVMSWVLAPFGFVGRCQCFGETRCLYLQGRSDKAPTKQSKVGSRGLI